MILLLKGISNNYWNKISSSIEALIKQGAIIQKNRRLHHTQKDRIRQHLVRTASGSLYSQAQKNVIFSNSLTGESVKKLRATLLLFFMFSSYHIVFWPRIDLNIQSLILACCIGWCCIYFQNIILQFNIFDLQPIIHIIKFLEKINILAG